MKATQVTQARAGADERQEAPGAGRTRPQKRAEVQWAPRSLLGFESLAMSSPGDASEVEADAAAQRLARGLPARVSSLPRPALQRRASGIPSAFFGVPFAPSDAGSPLPGGVRSTFGRLLGHDLGGVRVHTGADAARSADHLNADAYTVGEDVVFAEGRYAPETPPGRELLAHELAHVAQQRGGERRVQRHGRSSRTTSSSSAPHLPHGTTPSVARGLRILGQTRLDALDAALNADRTHPTHLTATARARPGATLLDLVGEVWFATRRHLVRMDRRGRLEEQDWLYEVSGSSLEPGGTYIFAEVQLTKGSQSTVRHLVRVDGVGGLSDDEVGTRLVLGTFLPLQQHGAAALARGRILAVIAPDQDSALESPTFSPSQARAALRRAHDLVPDECAHVARRIREDLLGFTAEQVLGFAQGALMGVVGSLGLAVMGTQILHDVLPMLELAGNAVSPADEVEFAGRGLARYFVETTISLLGGFAIGSGIRLARGLRSGGLRAWMRERLRALREPGQEAAGLAGLEARPARPALLRVLGELAAHFDVVENPQLRGDAARVVYDTPSGRPRLEVGPDASEFMVGRHRGVMRVVLRFYARFGLARRVMSRLGQLIGLGPGFGSNGWEARLEVVKLTQILTLLEPIYAQLAAQEAGMAPGRARPRVSEALMRQIIELRQQLAENELRVDSTSRGRGYVAAGGGNGQTGDPTSPAVPERAPGATDETTPAREAPIAEERRAESPATRQPADGRTADDVRTIGRAEERRAETRPTPTERATEGRAETPGVVVPLRIGNGTVPETAVVHRENIGAGLSPQQAARVIWVRLQALMRREVAHRRMRTALEAEVARAEADLRTAQGEQDRVLRELARSADRNYSPEARARAARDIRAAEALVLEASEARSAARERLNSTEARLNHREGVPGTNIESGRVYEGAYNPVTGEMAIVGSGAERATFLARPDVVRVRADGRPVTTIAGHCGMPRAADAVVSPELDTPVVVNRGGLRLYGERLAVEYVTACEQCEGMLRANANRGRVRTAGPVPRNVPPGAPANEPYDLE